MDGFGIRAREGMDVMDLRISISGVAALALLLWAAPRAEADAIRYSITDLGAPPGQIESVSPSGYVAFDFEGQAAIYRDGAVTMAGSLGGAVSRAGPINGLGQMVGSAKRADGTYGSYFSSNGSMQDLTTIAGGGFYAENLDDHGAAVGWSGSSPAVFRPGQGVTVLGAGTDATYGLALQINNQGQIVGTAGPVSASEHAFLYDQGRMVDLGTLGGSDSVARAISSTGLVAGEARTVGGEYHAFLYDAGTMHDLGTLGGAYSFARGVDAAGDVVGYSSDTGGVDRPFFYHDGRMVDLSSLLPTDSGWALDGNYLIGIDDAGRVTGTGTYQGQTHAFLLTPVPEPSTVAFFGVALLAAAGRSARRRWNAASAR